jgi:hypothetical protein
MLPEDYNYNKTYTFYIQNPEDFYNQLRGYHRLDLAQEQSVDIEDTDLAKDMLREIGVNV